MGRWPSSKHKVQSLRTEGSEERERSEENPRVWETRKTGQAMKSENRDDKGQRPDVNSGDQSKVKNVVTLSRGG